MAMGNMYTLGETGLNAEFRRQVYAGCHDAMNQTALSYSFIKMQKFGDFEKDII
jgi:hypothetical protein